MIPISSTNRPIINRISWLLLLPFVVGVFLSSCGDTPVDAQTQTSMVDSSKVNNNISFVPDNFNAVGQIQGTVIDKATGEALSDVAVTLQFFPEGADEVSTITDSTGSQGFFSYSGVPVNTDADYSQGSPNSPYTLAINTGELQNYRDNYRMNVPLTFESTGGDGAAISLTSDVTVPLSERSVKVMGKLQSDEGAVLSDVKVRLYQDFNPIINGGSDTRTDMLVDSTRTGSDGSFSFAKVEEKANIWLHIIDKSNSSEVIDEEFHPNEMTPSAEGNAVPEMELGVVDVTPGDQSGAFYLTSVTPEPGSDMHPDTVFKYAFNRPVADNEYTRTDLGFGSGTIKDDIQFNWNGNKKASGDVEFSVSWSDSRDTLSIDPADNLQDASEYTLDVSSALSHSKFVDEHGKGLDYGPSEYSENEVETLAFTTNANNSKPHTPTLNLASNDSVDYNSGSLMYSWQVDESNVEVKEYELWRKMGGGSYELVSTIDRDNMSFGQWETDLAPTQANPLVDVKQNNVPDEAITHSYKVRAISANLREGDFSNEITFADSTKPDVMEAEFAGSRVDVYFEEPMQLSHVEDPSNYTFMDDQGNDITSNISIEDITYYAQYGSYYVARINSEDVSNLQGGYSVVVNSDVSDLAGNSMDTNDGNNDNDGRTNEATLVDVAPHTPSITVVKSDPGIDYNDGFFDFQWEIVENPPAEVDYYEVYRKVADGNYSQYRTFDRSDAEFGEFDEFIESYNSSNTLVRPDNSFDNPDKAITEKYKVRAVSKDGFRGEFSDVITIADEIKPDVTNATYNGGNTLTVEFEEPMQKSLVETASNYTFEDSQGNDITSNITIESIEYDGQYDNYYRAEITVADGNNLNTGQTVIVNTNVTDLAGNGMDDNDSNNDNDGNNNSATY